jgi:glycosyltransferase domain-containing protein
MLSRLEAAIGAREWCRSGFDMAQKVTIFLPTYDRPEMLCKTLAFLQDTPDRFPIIVADGSNDHNGRKNAVACRQAGSNVTYFHFPTPVEALPPTEIPLLEDHHKIIANYYRRYLHALDQIVTPYVVHCSDDDLLIPETVAESAEFLDQNADYVACHGMYFNFRYLTDGLEIECATYDGPSLDGNEFAIRLIQLFSRYECPFAAVYRVSATRAIIPQLVKIRVLLFTEVFHATTSVAIGKIKRLNRLYYLRNVGVPNNPRPFQSWRDWYVKDFDEFFEQYREFRSMAMYLVAQTGKDMDADRLRRTIDMAFMVYAGREFHMLHWMHFYLTDAITDQDERERLRPLLTERLWNQSNPPPSGTAEREAANISTTNIAPQLRIPAEVEARLPREQWKLLAKRLHSSPGWLRYLRPSNLRIK